MNFLVFNFRASEYAAHFRSILADLVHRKEKSRKKKIFDLAKGEFGEIRFFRYFQV